MAQTAQPREWITCPEVRIRSTGTPGSMSRVPRTLGCRSSARAEVRASGTAAPSSRASTISPYARQLSVHWTWAWVTAESQQVPGADARICSGQRGGEALHQRAVPAGGFPSGATGSGVAGPVQPPQGLGGGAADVARSGVELFEHVVRRLL